MDTRPLRYRPLVIAALVVILAASAITTNPPITGLLPLAPATVFAFQEEPGEVDPVERERLAERDKLLERLREDGITEGKLREVKRLFNEDGSRRAPPRTAEQILAESTTVPDLMRQGKLRELVFSKDFAKFNNSTELAQAYLVSSRSYQIEGIRRDGRVDRVALSGKALWLAFGNDYLAALPRAKDQYERVSVQYSPDNSYAVHAAKPIYAVPFDPVANKGPVDLSGSHGSTAIVVGETAKSFEFSTIATPKRIELTREGESWRQTNPHKSSAGGPSRISPVEAQVRFMNVAGMGEGTVIDIVTPGATVGTNRWYVTKEDPGATAEIAAWINRSGAVVHAGDDLPADWLKALFAANQGAYVRRSQRSANALQSDFAAAAALGRKPLDASKAKVFNALPQETSLLASILELKKMGLNFSDRKPWQELNAQVQQTASSTGLPVVSANKTEVLHELQNGASDVILIVAHGSGETIYLPGTNGDLISADELAQIRRFIAPDRMAILITCKGGEVNRGRASIGEALLQHRLARAVFASSEDVDARAVPALIKELVSSGRPVQDVMRQHQFQKIVRDLLGLLHTRDS